MWTLRGLLIDALILPVMTGLVPAIHVFDFNDEFKTESMWKGAWRRSYRLSGRKETGLLGGGL